MVQKAYTSSFLTTLSNQVYSVIDFGDSQHNPLLYELGITIMWESSISLDVS